MPSELYREARSLLEEDDIRRLNSSEAWLAGQASGPRLLANLQRESHFVDKGTFGNPAAFKEFLRAWCNRNESAADDSGRQACFYRTCREHERWGTEIPAEVLPDQLIRYLVGPTLLREIIGQILGRAAKANFDSGMLTIEDAFSRIKLKWNPNLLRGSDRLGRGDTVFATFSNPGAAPGTAQDVVEAIAHPVVTASSTRDQFLFKFTYSSARVEDHRIPTIADACWCPLFEPASEFPPDPGDPHTCFGWTRPVGKQASQPELVHQNESLKVAHRAPRFLGWLKP